MSKQNQLISECGDCHEGIGQVTQKNNEARDEEATGSSQDGLFQLTPEE